jgi:predicted outer membrane protein
VIDRLKGLNGNDRDTAFVNHEIADHQSDISDTKSAISSTQNADVKALLQREMPELQKHLDRAQSLSKQLASKK